MARVLIIDDEDQIRSSLKSALERQAHECVTAEDIKQSIACMDKLDELGNYQYNFSEGETHFFENDKWFTKNQLLDYLNSKIQNKSRLWGDIFCKLIKLR